MRGLGIDTNRLKGKEDLPILRGRVKKRKKNAPKSYGSRPTPMGEKKWTIINNTKKEEKRGDSM